jgi:hypothetical protein
VVSTLITLISYNQPHASCEVAEFFKAFFWIRKKNNNLVPHCEERNLTEITENSAEKSILASGKETHERTEKYSNWLQNAYCSHSTSVVKLRRMTCST